MPFIKPENALKRAEEFVNVGKKRRALDTLYEVIRSKKHRTWQKIHEQIMKTYLNLCVDLKESHMAKDGLHQYKTICQNINVKSLEDVINGFLTLAEEKAEKAKKDAVDANILTDVDDLELINSPESVLLKAVSGESSQDRADRDLLAPWLKFVWESYKQSLELLKNNNKLETLYQQIVKQAFTFCVKYQRKTEFRKLCESLRQHMVQSQKYTNQATSIDLNKPETQNNHLEIRLFQLNYAISMELWQEAYKAVEDIYSLMNLSKTKPTPMQMYNYYSKLSLIFWKAGNHLYHAATLQKLFVLLKERKKTITQDELTKISTRLLLSTLAIPIPPNRSSIDECLDQDEVTLEKLKRLSSLLNLQQAPTRLSLLKDLAKYNVVQHVFGEVKDLYKWLEIEFHPLKLSERVSKCLDSIESRQDLANENYSQYIPAIKEIAVTRLVKQISQIYTSIEINRFIQLAPAGIDVFYLEKLIVDSAKLLDLQVRINHQSKSLHFGNDLYVAQKEDLPEGPTIQSMPSEQIRNQLITMSEYLNQAQNLIYYKENKSKRDDLVSNIAHVYRQTCEKHHIDLLRRKQLIDNQREMFRNIANEKAKQDEILKKQEEKERLAAQEKERLANFAYNQKEYLDSIRNNNLDNNNLVNDKEDNELTKQIEQLTKEKKNLMKDLKRRKKFDHFIRASHQNEVALIAKLAEEDAQLRKKFWEEKEIERIDNLKQEQQIQAENRERLLRMLPDKDKFQQLIYSARKEEYEKKMAEFKANLVKAREAKLLERKNKRKQDRKNAYFKEIEDRKRKEEEERKAREEEVKRRKLDEIAEKQRQKEREIEERLSKQQQQQQAQTADQDRQQQQQQQQPSSTGVYRPKAAGGAGFSRPPPPSTTAAAASSNADKESSWRRPLPTDENTDDSRSSLTHQQQDDKFVRRGPGENRGERGSGFGGRSNYDDNKKQSSENEWRRVGNERRGPADDDSQQQRHRGGPGGGDRGGDRGDRSDRGQGERRQFGGDRDRQGGRPRQGQNESKADSEDTWRRAN